MDKKYLPIGSVCTLAGRSKKVMITGYYSVKFNGNLKINDYIGCVYPEGLLISDQIISFNHSEIENIDFVGFKNEDQEKFMKLFNTLTGNISEEEKAANFHEKNDMFLTSNNTYSKLLFDENGVVMIADPVKEEHKPKSKGTFSDIKFDENGTVISVSESQDVNNPFHVEHKEPEIKQEHPNNWNIFNNIEFDENGTVVKADIEEKKKSELSEIKFDENGTVISVGGEDLKPKEDYSKYRFDENGTLVSVGDNTLQESNDNYDSNNSSKYSFDENGVVTSEKKTFSNSGIQFDENGTVISA